MTSKWESRRDDIQRMVISGMTDDQIGLVYDEIGRTIYKARRRLGIPSNPKRRRNTYREGFAAHEPPVPLEGETYVDEAGLTVTRFPARYAEGALVQSVTARPRR